MAEHTAGGTATPQPRGRFDKLRYGGLGLLAGLLLGAIASGLVYLDGRERLAELDQSRALRAGQVQQDIASVRQELDAARSMDALLRARIAADRALEELDRSNFGTSREQLRYVGVALAEVEPALVNIDPQAMNAARQLVEETVQGVAPDPLVQRDRLREVIRVVDGLIPPREPLG